MDHPGITSHKRRTLWTLLALLAAASILPIFPSPAYAQSTGWSTPQMLNPESQTGTFPEVAADPAGNVHFFWNSTTGQYDQVMYQSLSADGQWSSLNDIQALDNGVNRIITRPSADLDAQGNLYLTFRNFSIFYSSVAAINAGEAGAWSAPQLVNSPEYVGYFSVIKIDRSQLLHLIYTEAYPVSACSSCFGLYYRQSTDLGKNWSDPVRINSERLGAAKPQLWIDQQDTLHLIWESGVGGDLGQLAADSDVMYAQSTDHGLTWSKPVGLTAADDPFGKDPAIGITGTGSLVAAWVSTTSDTFVYTTSDNHGQTWAAPQPIPGVAGERTVAPIATNGSAMATDSAGMVHYVVVGRMPGQATQLSVIELNWNGHIWSAPTAIKTYTGDAPEWPRIAISKGNQMNVVWFVRDEKHIFDSDNGVYTVWYAIGKADAPEIKPVSAIATPTITPTATVAVTRTPTPTLSPTPIVQFTVAPLQTGPFGLGNPTYSEMDYLTLLGTTLIPSLVVVVIVVAIIALLRRRN